MANYWSYFRLDGDPQSYPGMDVFSVAIHHGGRFYSNEGLNREYRGGDVVYVDGVNPVKLSFNGFNYWAFDLGYTQGPIAYWFRIPGSEEGTGYLPIVNNADAVDMVQYISASRRVLDVYIVCLAPRIQYSERELERMVADPDHHLYIGHHIEDCPLTDDVVSSMGQQPEIGQEMEIDLEQIFNFSTRSEANFTANYGQHESGRRTRPSTGIHINEPVDGARAAAPTSNVSKNKGKGKEKVVEQPKRKVGRPTKRTYDTRSDGQSSRHVHAPAPTEDWSSESEDSDDPNYDGIIDSDYELALEDDEELFQQNVDGDTYRVSEYEEMGFEGQISDDGDDSDGLKSVHDTDDEGEDCGPFRVKGKKRFSNWVEFNVKTDMKNPKFKLGMIFPNAKVFKHAVRKHAVLTKKELRFPRNTKHMVLARCFTSPKCPFWLYASSPDKNNPTLQVRTYRPEHKCSSIGKRVYHCHAPFIAEEYKDQFLAYGKWSREGIQNAVARDFGMTIGHHMCYRAKSRARKLAQGTIEDQYNMLASYAHELKKRNPGSSIWIQTELDDEVARFKRMYICFAALREGWRAGCRPIIGLDGCHLRGNHKGQLLSAVGIDGNNGMYPIAWAIVEAETRDSWTWFLTSLKEDLEINYSGHYAFISDKQKGLEQAIKDLFPDANHRHCVRHLHNNFKTDGHIGLELKQRLWAVARATTMITYNKSMDELAAISIKASDWCKDRPAIHWSRSHFEEKIGCDILLNNHCESFNKTVLDARKKEIIPCLEDIRVASMVRLANRRNSGPRWRSTVGPRIEKLLKKNAAFVSEYQSIESSEGRFEVHGRGVACQSGVIAQHSVHLDMHRCTCRRWDLCGLPCVHAITAIYSKGRSADAFVSEWYTQKKYMEAYEVMLHPIAGVEEWEVIDRPIAPPLYRRQPGRPKTKRTKEPGEVPPPFGTDKLSKSFYSQITCGECGKIGHNKRSCARRNQGAMENVVEPHVQQANVEPANDVPLPSQESNFQAAMPNLSNLSGGTENVNVNVNFSVNVESQDEGNTIGLFQANEHLVNSNTQPSAMSQDGSVRLVSSGKRYKQKAMRINPKKSTLFAEASSKNNENF